MDMQSAINTVTQRQNLTHAEMTEVMQTIMSGQATPSQIGGFLVGLRMKGETVDEIVAAAKVMRTLATPVNVKGPHLIDTCGTGGDSSGTFNISTASAFVVAAAGGKVAKHGNRSISSKSGSADVLEAAGVRLDLNAEQVAQCIEHLGVGFMFAPQHHSAMKHAIGPRREMGVRTIFNVLGPLTNPAGAPNQVLGVFSDELLEPLANVLKQLGSEHVLVVNADDGMDEISISSATQIAELKNGQITTYTVTPEQFGLQRADITSLKVDDAAQSLKMIQSVFDRTQSAALDIVKLNAGAAIYAAGLSDNLAQGIQKADEVITNGAAKQKFESLIQYTQTL